MARVPTAQPSGEEGHPWGRCQSAVFTKAHASEKPVILALEFAAPSLLNQRAGKRNLELERVSVAVPWSPDPDGHRVTAGADAQKASGESRTG